MTQPPADIIAAARAAQAKWKVPASVQLAQWALESGWGAHSPGNNPFGIKALAGYQTQTLMTTEFVHGAYEKVPQTFAAFASVADAFDVHAKLLATSHYYTPAMAALPNVALFVQRMACHYATDPHYADRVLAVIKGSNLGQYDV
jgi:flagellum-specific peptidoglycan hydrolase FlgJ